MVEHQRYLNLKKIINDLENGDAVRVTEWYDEHYDLLENYSTNLAPYSNLHPELDDPRLRFNLETLDEISTQLMKDYSVHRWFSLYDYYRFNTIIVEVVDYICDLDEEDRLLSGLFGDKICLSGETN